jgi:hypothetical protein
MVAEEEVELALWETTLLLELQTAVTVAMVQ